MLNSACTSYKDFYVCNEICKLLLSSDTTEETILNYTYRLQMAAPVTKQSRHFSYILKCFKKDVVKNITFKTSYYSVFRFM